jgi:hypothetical protein
MINFLKIFFDYKRKIFIKKLKINEKINYEFLKFNIFSKLVMPKTK